MTNHPVKHASKSRTLPSASPHDGVNTAPGAEQNPHHAALTQSLQKVYRTTLEEQVPNELMDLLSKLR